MGNGGGADYSPHGHCLLSGIGEGRNLRGRVAACTLVVSFSGREKKDAPAGNRTRGERMGTVHFTTKPLALLDNVMSGFVYIKNKNLVI